MIVGARIASLLKDQGISQGELARRVGVSQPTIFKMIHENKTGSAHLHKVARELGTTPAYLSGETDDPDSALPDEPELSAEERGVVDCLRQIAPKDRAALVQLARSLATSASIEQPRAGDFVVANLLQNPASQFGTKPDERTNIQVPAADPKSPVADAIGSSASAPSVRKRVRKA